MHRSYAQEHIVWTRSESGAPKYVFMPFTWEINTKGQNGLCGIDGYKLFVCLRQQGCCIRFELRNRPLRPRYVQLAVAVDCGTRIHVGVF